MELKMDPVLDNDSNLNRILDQQVQIKMIIEKDGRIKSLKKALSDHTRVIEHLRKECARIAMDNIRNRQELLEVHARELEQYQMNQLRSIADDYRNHQAILEQRKRDVIAMRKETENEETNREAYLASVEKDLDKQLQSRQRMSRGLQGFSMTSNVTDELYNPNHLELTSVEEYAPYGAAPHSRLPPKPRRGRGRGRGRGGAASAES